MDNAKKVLDQIIYLYEGYSREYRASTQPFRLEMVRKRVKGYKYQHDDKLVREPLIEHVGSLSVVATTVFPHLASAKVDLGLALTMLAIHDIGEIVVGDEIAFTKDGKEQDNERKQALLMLPESLQEIYLEMEGLKSDTARFAKAIDKMTPDIVDLITPPEITIERYKHFTNKKPDEIVGLIKEFKHPYMTWDAFLTKLHLEILKRIEEKLKL